MLRYEDEDVLLFDAMLTLCWFFLSKRSWRLMLMKIKVKNLNISNTVQKIKFSIKDFFSKCDQVHKKLRIWSHLLKKSLMENIFLAVLFCLFKFVDSLSSVFWSIPSSFCVLHSSYKLLLAFEVVRLLTPIYSWRCIFTLMEATIIFLFCSFYLKYQGQEEKKCCFF